MKRTFSIKLIVVKYYLSYRIQMYLTRNFHLNTTLSHAGFKYFTVDYLYFFSPRKYKHLGVTFKWINRVWVRIFGKPTNNYNLGKQSLLTIFFSLLPHPLPMLHPPLRVSKKSIIGNLTGESFKTSYIFEVQYLTSLLQCVPVTDFFKRSLFASPTNYMFSKVILN